MMQSRKVALPYRVLHANDVVADPIDGWELATGDGIAPTTLRDGDVVESWDSLTKLSLHRSYSWPVDLASRLGLREDSSRFALVVHSVSAGALAHDRLFKVELTSDLRTIDVSVQPDSTRLVRDLELVTELLVMSASASSDPLAPALAGARLWNDRVRLRLEGGRGRIPMEAPSFRSEFHGRGFEDALFHVEIVPDLELDIEEGLRIYINADQPAFVAAVTAREPIASALLGDGVIRRVVAAGLAAEELGADDIYAEGSVGLTLRRWLRQAFPTMSLPSIKELARSEPAVFEATLDSWSGMGRRAYSSSGEG